MSTATRKVVVNRCFGGFSLSPAAVKRMAELQGRQCFFFVCKPGDYRSGLSNLVPTDAPGPGDFMFWAFDTNEFPDVMRKDWAEMTDEEKTAQNEWHSQHYLDNRPDKRDDPLLVQAVEELGEAANGRCAQLEIVEIPADANWEIAEYDGSEHIAEVHRTW